MTAHIEISPFGEIRDRLIWVSCDPPHYVLSTFYVDDRSHPIISYGTRVDDDPDYSLSEFITFMAEGRSFESWRRTGDVWVSGLRVTFSEPKLVRAQSEVSGLQYDASLRLESSHLISFIPRSVDFRKDPSLLYRYRITPPRLDESIAL